VHIEVPFAMNGKFDRTINPMSEKKNILYTSFIQYSFYDCLQLEKQSISKHRCKVSVAKAMITKQLHLFSTALL
jgi:hypothetical protein